MKNLFASLVGLTVVATGVPALADYSPPLYPDNWNIVRVGNCNAVLHSGSFRLDANGVKTEEGGEWLVNKSEWTGACDANGLISGPGSIRLYTWIKQKNGPGYFTNYYNEYRGTAKSGMLDGPFTGITANYNEQSSRYDPVVWEDEPGEVPAKFEKGCLRDAFQEECDIAKGQAVLKQYLSSRGVGDTAATSSAKPQPTVQPAGAGAATAVAGDQSQPVMPIGLSAERKEKAFDAVSGALMAALNGDAATINTGSRRLDRLIEALSNSLRSGDGADLLGSNGGLLDTVLGEVRSALGPNLPANANQLADLALGELKRALAKPRPITPPAAVGTAATGTGNGQPSMIGINLDALRTAITDAGYPMEIRVMGDNTRYLFGSRFDVYLYNCTGNDCKTIQLISCNANPNASLTKINELNRDKLYGSRYLSSNGSACISMQAIRMSGSISFEDLKDFTNLQTVVFDEDSRYYNK